MLMVLAEALRMVSLIVAVEVGGGKKVPGRLRSHPALL